MAETMGEKKKIDGVSVPREIILEILKRVPVKSLIRLRSVSKLWCSIIDNPSFIHLHHNHSHTQPGSVSRILLEYKDYDGSQHPVGGPDFFHLLIMPCLAPLHSSYKCRETLQSVNGFVCIDHRIWNPSTRESIAIPLPPGRSSLWLPLGPPYELPCHSQFYSTYLLGFDPSSHQYKILNKYIAAHTRGKRKTRQVEYKILTIGTNSWRDIAVPHQLLALTDQSLPLTDNYHRCCCIAGVVYSFGLVPNHEVIVAFELEHEKFRIIPLPHDHEVDYGNSYLIQVREGLALINHGVTTISILEDYENNVLWKTQSFIFPDHCEGKPIVDKYGQRIRFEPIGAIHTGEILLISPFYNYCVYDRKSSAPTFFYYGLESKRLRMVDELSNLRSTICLLLKNY